MIGSTDSHTGLATADQDNFFGKTSSSEPSPTPRDRTRSSRRTRRPSWAGRQVASGYAAVWATDNTRDAIFDAHAAPRDLRHDRPAHGRALLRRLGLRGQGREEPHAGVRRLRQGRADGRRPARRARRASHRPSSSAALKDPIGANLDRIQVIKGWLDKDGELHEKVYDVAWGGDRKPDAKTGKLPPVGSTVDVAEATWTNTIGAPELITVWKDPDFDPSQRAFYYARVIEIPTPRWTAYDAKRFGVKMDKEIPHDDAGARLHVADLVYAEGVKWESSCMSGLPAQVRE